MADLVVAVTGGIASGKTELTRRFATLGVVIADADVIAREVVAPGQPALAEIAARFGPDVLDASGQLDRAMLRTRVFADQGARRDLESITHPRIRDGLARACRSAEGPYVVAAIPLLAEAGGRQAYPWLARVLVVDAPLDRQRARLRARDGADDLQVERMIAAQASREDRLAIADDVVVNDGPADALDAVVARLDRMYRRAAGAARG